MPIYTFTTLDDPSATQLAGGTHSQGINDAGQIVGVYDNPGLPGFFTPHGFLLSGGIYTTLDDPLATFGTQAFGINDAGQIVGTYFIGTTPHGFLYSGGTYTTIDFRSATLTFAQGINAAGQIVGTYQDASGGTHGFLYFNGFHGTIDDPLATGPSAPLRRASTPRARSLGLTTTPPDS